jgi:hypothetical protein
MEQFLDDRHGIWGQFTGFFAADNKKQWVNAQIKRYQKDHLRGTNRVQFKLTRLGLEIGRDVMVGDRIVKTKLFCSEVHPGKQEGVYWVD